jgi:hypothetical protein
VGWTGQFVTEVGGEKADPVVLEGSEYVHAPQLQCPPCLPQRQAHGESHYSPRVVSATVTRAGSHAMLPLAGEAGRNREGQEPQECELTAATRVGKRLRAEPRQLAMGIVGADV